MLTLRIDGQEVSFGDKDECDYPRFWMSAGDCGQDKGNVRWEPHRAGWVVRSNKLPVIYKKLGKEFIRLMDQNIRPWCNGKCRFNK